MDCNTIKSSPDASAPLPTRDGESLNIAAIRAQLLDGLATLNEFGAAVDKGWRTVYNWTYQGLPVVRIGNTPYIPIAEGRAWLLKRGASNCAVRKPGRPRKAA